MKELIGKRIVNVRKQTEKEMKQEDWDSPATVIELEDGTEIYASRDDEGNGPGTIFGRKEEKCFYVMVN